MVKINLINPGAVDIIRTAYYIHGPESLKLIFAVLYASQMMDLTRCYKMAGFFSFIVYRSLQRLGSKLWLRHFAHPSPNVYRGGKVQNLASNVDPQSLYNSTYLKAYFGSADDCPMYFIFWCSTLHQNVKYIGHSSLRTQRLDIALTPVNEPVKIVNKSATPCLIVLKFDELVHYGTHQGRWIVKIHFWSIQDGGRSPNFQSLNRCNSSAAADCSISLKFDTEFDHITADTSVKGQGHLVNFHRSPKCPYDVENRSHRIERQYQNFDGKLRNSSFCAYAVWIWLKTLINAQRLLKHLLRNCWICICGCTMDFVIKANKDWRDGGFFAMLRNCHFFQFFANVAICHRPSVCMSSVCNVRAPYSDDWNFR